ncbi:DUF4262 domain-containing protein [Amycolatopsis sp. NPDC051758]|uniref:DUF4262 domain-containing protein n=1 Tax=Amycolatopsis sp. NPDC051758 TaxID=3363935 RepID=UPI0037A43439
MLEAHMNAYLQRIRDQIERVGWAVPVIVGENSTYAYTVGLTSQGLPEIFCDGLDQQTSAGVLNHLAQRQIEKGAFGAGTRLYVDGRHVLLEALPSLASLVLVRRLFEFAVPAPRALRATIVGADTE